jgi:hypothetical protein
VARGKWPNATGDGDFAVYLEHQPAPSRELFWRFLELAQGCGPAIFELQPGIVVLRGERRIFSSVRVRPDGLAGHIVLARPVTDRRLSKPEPLTKRLYSHGYRVTAPEELDSEFAGWLSEAREVGFGRPPRPNASVR